MSRRRRLLRRTLLWCAIPVAVAGAVIVWQSRSSDAPYVPGETDDAITRSLDRDSSDRTAPIRFADVTAESGISFDHFPFERTSQLPEDMGPGAAWGDYDRDGFADLFLVNFAAPLGVADEAMSASLATDRLYRNLGDGTFEDVTVFAGVGRAHRGMGAAWADADGDGDLDLCVTAWGSCILWENLGDGTFADVTERAGIAEEGFWSGASWADADLDGDLDLYVCGYVVYDPVDPEVAQTQIGDFPFTLNPSSWPAHGNRFYVNRGDGTFEERGASAGIAGARGKSLGAAWADFDADGWPDLYVANDVSDNAMYRNLGDGTFEDVSYEAVVADYRGAMGIAVGDWDSDLDLDLFITHWIAQENALYTNQQSQADAGAPMLFVDDADGVGLGQIALDAIGWGTAFIDFDNDGHEDLFVANGSTFQESDDPTQLVPMHPHLYASRGAEEGFFEIGEAAGMRTDPPGVGRGGATCDYDADGDVDLLICRHGGPARLLRNDSPKRSSVGLRVEDESGRPALGARVTLHAAERAFLREVGAGPSYLSQNDTDLTIGLGTIARIDSVVVAWPGASREVFRDLSPGAMWRVRAGEPLVRERDLAARGSTRESRAIVADLSTHLTRDQVRRFWALKKEATRHLVAAEWTQAAGVLEQMVALDGRHDDSLYSLGNCYLELGRYAEAAKTWERLVEANSASARGWTQIGLVHSLPHGGELFDLAAAAAAFSRAHELNPEESGRLILWGEAELARGNFESAREKFSAAYQTNHRATAALFLCGYIAWKGGERAEADALFARAIESVREEAPVRGVLGEGDTRTGEMLAERRRTASRRLFAECVAALREAGAPVSADTAFSCVDRYRAERALN